MVFKRKKRPLHKEIRELLWPSMGWKRTLRYFKYRLVRLQDSPSKVARGIATGVAISFVPLPGTHFIQVILICWALRGNIFAGLLCSWVGNPWTFPPMWYFAYVVGEAAWGAMGLETTMLPHDFSFGDLWHAMMADFWLLVLPWVAGGYIVMAAVWPVTYYAVRPLVSRAQHAHTSSVRISKHSRTHGHTKP